MNFTSTLRPAERHECLDRFERCWKASERMCRMYQLEENTEVQGLQESLTSSNSSSALLFLQSNTKSSMVSPNRLSLGAVAINCHFKQYPSQMVQPCCEAAKHIHRNYKPLHFHHPSSLPGNLHEAISKPPFQHKTSNSLQDHPRHHHSAICPSPPPTSKTRGHPSPSKAKRGRA